MALVYYSLQVYIEFEGTVQHTGGAFARVAGEMAIDDVILTDGSTCSDWSSMYHCLSMHSVVVLYSGNLQVVV